MQLRPDGYLPKRKVSLDEVASVGETKVPELPDLPARRKLLAEWTEWKRRYSRLPADFQLDGPDP